MSSLLARLVSTDAANKAALPLRLALGLVMAGHGAQKLLGWFGGYGLEATGQFFASKLGLTPGLFWASLAAGGEFFGGLALLAGLGTRIAAANTVVIMAVAIWTAHRTAFFLQANGMEYALTLLLVAVALLFTGGGAFSLDARLQPRRPHPAQA